MGDSLAELGLTMVTRGTTMTHSESNSAETSEAAIAAETSAPIPAQTDTTPATRRDVAANERRSAIQSLENLASSERSLTDLLDEAKALLGTSNPEPSGMSRGQSEANETARPAEIQRATSGAPPTHAGTADPLHRSRHTIRIGRRALLQVVAALGAAVIGYAFGHVVAGNDTAMRFFFAAAVAMGLFLVFSAFATQINRRWRPRL